MRRMVILCLLWVGCAQTTEAPPPAPEPPPVPAQPSPAALGVTVIGMALVKMNTPSIFVGGESGAALVLLVIEGPTASRARERGETIGGHWMIGQAYAHEVASSPGWSVLAVKYPGADLARERLWFFESARFDPEGDASIAELRSAQLKAHRRVEGGTQASLALGDGDKPTVEIEDRGEVSNVRQLGHLAQAFMEEKILEGKPQ